MVLKWQVSCAVLAADWIRLFLCAVAAQVFFALMALYHGVKIDFEVGQPGCVWKWGTLYKWGSWIGTSFLDYIYMIFNCKLDYWRVYPQASKWQFWYGTWWFFSWMIPISLWIRVACVDLTNGIRGLAGEVCWKVQRKNSCPGIIQEFEDITGIRTPYHRFFISWWKTCHRLIEYTQVLSRRFHGWMDMDGYQGTRRQCLD